MKTAFYLRHYALSFAVLALFLAGCNKDESSSTPTYGYINLGKEPSVKLSIANESTAGSYNLTNQGQSSDVVIQVTAQMPARPTGKQDYELTETTYITYAKLKNGVTQSISYFGAPGEKIKADLVNGKVVLSLDNLTEVDNKHNQKAGSTLLLSGQLSGR